MYPTWKLKFYSAGVLNYQKFNKPVFKFHVKTINSVFNAILAICSLRAGTFMRAVSDSTPNVLETHDLIVEACNDLLRCIIMFLSCLTKSLVIPHTLNRRPRVITPRAYGVLKSVLFGSCDSPKPCESKSRWNANPQLRFSIFNSPKSGFSVWKLN